MTQVVHIEEDLIAKLDEPIAKPHLSVREGRGNTKYYYVKQAILADYLNQVFGPLGWDLKAGDPTIDRRIEARTKKRNNQSVTVDYVVFEVVIKVTLRIKARTTDSSDTIFQLHGVGSGEAEVGQSAKDELGKAIKGAESDGLKRCAQEIGRRFGLMLTTRGTQDAIDYAQANDNMRRQEMHRTEEQSDNNRGNSRNDRDDKRGSTNNETSRSRREEPAAEPRERSNSREPEKNAPRSEDRNQEDKRETRNVQADEKSRDKPRDEPRDERPAREAAKKEDRQESNSRDEKPDNAGSKEKSETGNGKGEKTISDQYDIDILPMTTPEQASFAKTLLRVIGETSGGNREDLVAKHHDTVRNLDGRIKNRFIDVLRDDYNIEFNAVRA